MLSTPSYNAPQNLETVGYDATACDKGVVWSAIFGGAVTTAVFSFLLSSLVAALGFAVLSPGDDSDNPVTAFAISGAIALIAVQWISSAFGGYITGRLRTEWTSAHKHEVFFRDTVHGFLSWVIAALLGIVLLALSTAHLGHEGSSRDRGAWHDHGRAATYYVDRLFRVSPQQSVTISDEDRHSAGRILAIEAVKGNVSDEDKSYLTQLLSARLGFSDTDAAKRVDDTFAEEKDGLKQMSKYGAVSALFIFFAMIMGAFISSVAGALGGQHRDLHYTTGSLSE